MRTFSSRTKGIFRITLWRLGFCLGAMLMFGVTGWAQQPCFTLACLGADDWKVLTPPGKQSAMFSIGPGELIEVKAETAVSFLYAELAPLEAGQKLSWRWRVDDAPTPSELSKSGMDDRPLAINLWFPLPEEHKSFWNSVKSALGVPVFGYAITYVWGGTNTPGEIISNPHAQNSVLIVLRGGLTPQGLWFWEEVDLWTDFERAFGHPPTSAPQFIAISADTDDNGGVAVGQIADLEFGSL